MILRGKQSWRDISVQHPSVLNRSYTEGAPEFNVVVFVVIVVVEVVVDAGLYKYRVVTNVSRNVCSW